MPLIQMRMQLFHGPHFSPAVAVSTTHDPRLLAPPVPRSRCNHCLFWLKRLHSTTTQSQTSQFRGNRVGRERSAGVVKPGTHWGHNKVFLLHPERHPVRPCSCGLLELRLAIPLSRGNTGSNPARAKSRQRGKPFDVHSNENRLRKCGCNCGCVLLNMASVSSIWRWFSVRADFCGYWFCVSC